MSNVISINQQQFGTEVLQSPMPVVVDFYATWCPPCRMLAPMLDKFSNEFAGRIKFVKINSDEEPELSNRYDVTGLPTIMLVENGKVIGKFAGLPKEDSFRDELARWVSAVN